VHAERLRGWRASATSVGSTRTDERTTRWPTGDIRRRWIPAGPTERARPVQVPAGHVSVESPTSSVRPIASSPRLSSTRLVNGLIETRRRAAHSHRVGNTRPVATRRVVCDGRVYFRLTLPMPRRSRLEPVASVGRRDLTGIVGRIHTLASLRRVGHLLEFLPMINGLVDNLWVNELRTRSAKVHYSWSYLSVSFLLPPLRFSVQTVRSDKWRSPLRSMVAPL